MRFLTFYALVFLTGFCSCSSQHAVITNYLQNVDTSGRNTLNLPEPRIQKNDLLSIKVYSQSADPRTDIPYNLPDASAGSTTGGSASGFLVDADGNIDYPRVGVLHAEGLTKAELARQLKERLATALNHPSVIVRFLNYRITVLGEVKTPGTFTLPTERITILEALGLAGDVTDFGNKDHVKIARENNGELQIGTLSLTSDSLFRSPYFRLQQNDVVFVEQNRRKEEQYTMQQQQVTAQRIGLVSSIVSVLAIVYSIIRR